MIFLWVGRRPEEKSTAIRIPGNDPDAGFLDFLPLRFLQMTENKTRKLSAEV